MKRAFIIAEAGVNHNGSVRTAQRMVEAAAEAGADAVKFQTFRADSLVSGSAPKAEYQIRRTSGEETQREMIRRYELGSEDHKKLLDRCKTERILFLSSPFDLESIDLLDRLGLKIFKIPSGELTNLPYLKKLGGLKKRIIMSTGMADLDEVRSALAALIAAGTARKKITLLQCVTEYPAAAKDANLRAMLTLQREFKTDVGYSDHTVGIEVALAAAALGASVIEKHFTLDKSMPGPDHAASLDPGELRAMVASIRTIEAALGTGTKKPSFEELRNRGVIRKSIVAAEPIRKGERFTQRNITAKRPANGISPMRWDEVLGRKARADFEKDDAIRL